MPKDNTTADSNANKVFDMPVSLKAGEVNTLSFPQDSIKSMSLTADNQLQISFRDGSKIEVENFQELVNSAQSCGRDTIIQLSDNTIIYPEELNTQLAQGPVSFSSGTMASGEGSDDGSFSISMPRAGQVIERDINDGGNYKLGFAMGDAISAAQAGQNLILTFNDGGVLVLKNYFPATTGANPAEFSYNTGETVDTASLMSSCKLAAIPTVAESVAENAPAQPSIAMVEPAAGEEVTEKAARVAKKAAKKASVSENVADIEPASGADDAPKKIAQKAPQDPGFQDIEPAAGDAGAQLISGNRGGFGFASTLQDATFATSNAIGPIGPTALGYQAPDFPVGQIRGTVAPLSIVPPGPVPGLSPSTTAVDETNFGSSGGNTNSGTVTATNGPVTFTFNDGFGVSGSVAGGRLTSCGDPVTVTRAGNVFTGKLPNGDTVFTMTLNSDGTYNYVQSKPLDHADTTNPNDLMTLTFGVTGTNANGSGTTFISVNVRDDGPVAVNDGATVGSAPLVVTGNILTNDSAGQDGGMKLVSFTFDGVTKQFVNGQPVTFETTRGNITVNENGSYSYTSKNTVLGTDEFSYVIKDCDGDTSSARLSVAVTDLDTTPIFLGSAAQIVDDTNLLGSTGTNVVNGNVPFDFKADAPGTITANGQFSSNGDKANNALTSNGVPVDVVFNAQTNTWVGTAAGQPVFTMLVRADGSYTFTQQAQLDHSVAGTQSDKINLVFGVTGTDSDGDTASGTVTITVLDDAPVARDDGSSVAQPGGTVNGNVITNDTMSKDVTTLKSVTVNGVTTPVAATGETTIQGTYGVLKIQANGTYTYTADPAKGGKDTFTYTLIDKDGDTSSANLDITTVQRPDGTPTITGGETTIDETSYTFGQTVNGTYSFNYGSDGQGATGGITSAYVGAEGSVPAGGLRSGGVPVTVAQVGSSYVGTANGVEVFRVTINTNGTYSYVQSRPLDHANGSDPNDQLALRFRLTITDADGDRDADTNGNNDIVIKVLDDGPSIGSASNNTDDDTAGSAGGIVSGTISGLNFGKDGAGTLSGNAAGFTSNGDRTANTLSSNGAPITVSYDAASKTYTGSAAGTAVFTLVLGNNGQYTFTQLGVLDHSVNSTEVDAINLVFPVIATDADGDTATGSITIRITDDAPVAVADTNSSTTPGAVMNGNVLSNDTLSKDNPNTVKEIKFGGQTVQVPTTGEATVQGTFGVLKIRADGSYTYTADANKGGTDTFTYVMADRDGDRSEATLGVTTTQRIDGTPVISGSEVTIDETSYTFGQTVNGTYSFNYGTDGQGATGSITSAYVGAEGSVPNGGLRSGGVPVTVAQVGSSYVGTANGVEVFRVTINSNGTYSYVQSRPLDHANGSDPNDQLALRFRLTITDADGDRDADTNGNNDIVIKVLDDGPSINDSAIEASDRTIGTPVNGVLTGINFGKDGAGKVEGDGTFMVWKADGTPLTLHSGGIPVAIVYNATTGTYVGTANGASVFTLKVNTDGTYTFTQQAPFDHQLAQDFDDANFHMDYIDMAFGARIIDADGDSDLACIHVRVDDSGPDARDDLNSVTTPGGTVNGNVVTNDVVSRDTPTTVKEVKFGNVTVSVPTTGEATINGAFGVMKIRADGSYTYTADPSKSGLDTFTYTIVDRDGDFDQANVSISTSRLNGVPVISGSETVIDETSYTFGQTVNGTYSFNYGSDGQGATGGITSAYVGAEGSVPAGGLRSGGVPVTVAQVGSSYVGTANGVEVFRVTINTNGTYSYVQSRPLDHANGSDPNDQLALRFRLTITDADGDRDADTNGNNDIVIKVLDDGPSIGSASNNTDDDTAGSAGGIVSGSISGLNFGKDGAGTLSGNAAGFTSNGDRTANTLSSNGVPITVSYDAASKTYTGSAAGTAVFTLVLGNNGSYTFTQLGVLDHSVNSTETDAINLVFPVIATDADGDTATGSITIRITDDAPVAVADTNSSTTPGAVMTGNVLSNDTLSKDNPNTVKEIKFGGQTVQVPTTGEATVQGTFGVLKIRADGSYTYTADADKGGTDTFTYVMADRDGDRSEATLGVTTTQRIDGTPVISGSETVIDETNYTFGQTVNGTYSFNYGTDGQGATGGITSAYVGAEGSVPNGGLRSGGVPVTVAQVGSSYVGTANGVEVFRVTINSNGTYSYVQSRPLDHANGSDPNDQLALRFRLTITDADGDRDADTNGNNDIVIKVLDDAPIANNDGSFNVGSGVNYVGAVSLLANDTLSKDGGTTVREIKFGNQTVQVPATGETSINGAFGILTIRADGSYSYRAGTNAGGTDTFTYVIRDADGDQSQANISFNAASPTPFGVTLEVCDVVVWEDSFCFLHFVAKPTGGDGDEVITVKLENIPAGWVLKDANGVTINPVNGVYSFTGAAGQMFDGNNIKIYPPANSDRDISAVRVTATIFDPDTNTTASPVINNFKVITNADADVPNLTLSVGNVVNGQADVAIATSLNDNDGSERITAIRIAAMDANGNYVGLPYGVSFNKGTQVGGEWQITNLADLQGLKMHVPNGTSYFKLAVISEVTEVNARTNGEQHEGDDGYLYNYAIVADDVYVGHNTGSGVTATATSGGDGGNTATATTGGGDHGGGVTATAISGDGNIATATVGGGDPTNTAIFDYNFEGLIGDHTIALPDVVHFEPAVLPSIQLVDYFDDVNQPFGFPINNFNAAEGDMLDISNVVAIDTAVDLAITDFVYARSTVEGVSVNVNGHDIANLQGVDNVNVNDIITISQINQNNGQV